MAVEPEKTSDLAALLERNREEIAASWTEKVRALPGSRYLEIPLPELTASMTWGLKGIIQRLLSGSYDELEDYLVTTSLLRLEQGFDIGEILEALLLWKETTLHFLRKEYPRGLPEAYEALGQLDVCLRYMIRRFVKLYSEAMQRDLREEQQRTALMLQLAQQRLGESQSLQRVVSALLQRLSLPEVLEVVCTEALRLTGAVGSTAFLLEEGWLRVAYSVGAPCSTFDRVSVEGSLTGRVVRQGQALLTNDPDSETLGYFGDTRPGAILSVPLRVKGSVIGALDVVDKPGGFVQEDLRIMGLLADEAAIAIENARLHQQVEQLAVMEERQRLARELHDSVTQSLYSMSLYAEAAGGLMETGDHKKAARHVRELRDTALEALREMRLLIFELHPPVLEKEGLVAALQARLEAVEARGGLQTELRAEGYQRLSIAIEDELYRIVQEALNNVLKHAAARRVTVDLQLQGNTGYVEVSDDGVGFDPTSVREKGGVGLRSMQERAHKIRARLEVESGRGKGTRVKVTWNYG